MGFIKEKGLVSVCTCESLIMRVKCILNMCSAREVRLLHMAVVYRGGGRGQDLLLLLIVLFANSLCICGNSQTDTSAAEKILKLWKQINKQNV